MNFASNLDKKQYVNKHQLLLLLILSTYGLKVNVSDYSVHVFIISDLQMSFSELLKVFFFLI